MSLIIGKFIAKYILFIIVMNCHEIIIQNISNCEYYDINCTLVNGNSDDALILLHVNIRSLQKNFDPLCELITLLNFTPQIICITETRIKDQPLINVAIPNYSFVHANSTSNAGGVAVYLHCSLKYILYHQQFCLSNSECMWIKVCSWFLKFILGVVYRHPCGASVDKFIDDFDNVLDVFTTEGKLFYILGDFNINTALEKILEHIN